MYETEYLKLKVAQEDDFYNINEHAENMEKIDDEFKKIKEEQLTKTGDTKDNIVTFKSEDTLKPSGWTDTEPLKTSEEHSSIFKKLSVMVKNIRWLYKLLGTADITKEGDGTVTGALIALSKKTEGLNTLSEYTTVVTPNPTIGPQIIQKESEIFDFDGNKEPFPIQDVVEGHELALRQLNTDTKLAVQSVNAIKGLRLITATLTTDQSGSAYVNPDVVGNFYLVLAAASNTMDTYVRAFNNAYGMQYLFVTHADLKTPFVGTFAFWILVI